MAVLAGPVTIAKVEIRVFRAPIAVPVRTSFGTMHDRPAVIVRVEDGQGNHGWGEVWCNFPSCGAEHRARLVETAVVPHVLGKTFADPAEAFDEMTRGVEVLALQADEPGPLAQAVAGVDIALWDMAARRAGRPLHALLGTAGMTVMPAYASGINHPGVAETIARSRSEGYRAFKIKIGFGEARDMENLDSALGALEPGETLAVDSNQAWSLPQALDMVQRIGSLPLLWLEEPLRCDSPAQAWRQLAAASPLPLAGGENMRSTAAFAEATSGPVFGVVQPDVCKWGGLTRCREVATAVLAAGKRYCPHYLGGGIGLMASAHLLAAVGGDGMLEVDCNANPLREMLATPYPPLRDGRMTLSDAPGLGVEPDLDALKMFQVAHMVCA